MRKIEIYPDRPYLILQVPSGVVYSTQAGCVACHHPETEGYLIDVGNISEIEQYCEYTTDFCNKNTLNEINGLLSQQESTGYKISVDENRIDEAQEAWLPVVMKKIDSEIFPSIHSFPDEMKAILIWENCD